MGSIPVAPSKLTAETVTPLQITLTWLDNSKNETGFKIERKRPGEGYKEIKTLGPNVTAYTDSSLANKIKYSYRVRAYNNAGESPYSNEANATTGDQDTIISLIIGQNTYYVNSKQKTMDTEPIIRDSRTYLPIRYVAEAFGAKAAWDNPQQKVTITMKNNVIELWIGNNTASVNGQARLIDSSNTKVKPIVVEPGRIMLPIRFIAENMGCSVYWNQNSNEVTVVYSP
ncbi:hypothetical protein N752_28810 [Desulforamulus aquiferis]|nr:stalk domain-containing protein [Desulforamulus aquiferis]RYD01579.1 hypothetical protein N752_28810 [Desulforamulus aquiferis]